MSSLCGRLLLVFALLLGGCASVPREPGARAEFKAHHDPLEPLNRRIFAFNLFIDRILIKPIAKGYRRALPEPARDTVRRFLNNLNEPVVFANAILQGRFTAAGKTGRRFLLNSTRGVAGLTDVATGEQLPAQVADFGQTLWAWGIHEGPYLVLPLFGPSSPRDGVGSAADVYFDPFRYIAESDNYPTFVPVGRTVIDGVDKRARNIETLDVMQHEAVDYYASLRSLFQQNRAAELRGAGPAAPLPAPGLYEDPGR